MSASESRPVALNQQQLHPMEASALFARRERVFLLLAGLFLGSLTMLNILGTSRFMVFFSITPDAESLNWNWGNWGTYSFAAAVGVLPYPVTFLCTDLISEFWGRRRANWLVFVGLLLNLWVIVILWLAGIMPPVPTMDPVTGIPPLENLTIQDGKLVDSDSFVFYRIQTLTIGAVAASMIAYLAAQFCDVYLFHFWKRLTAGKHLWLRNNGSTLISQLVDSVAVILLTHFYAAALPLPSEGTTLTQHLLILIATGYVFKMVIALLDTIPFYFLVIFLRNYLRFDPITEKTLA